MKKTIIIYGSTMGNTETLAGYIAAGAGDGITNVPVSSCKVEDLSGYDLLLLGSSTWGYGELQDDFIPFYDALANVDLTGKMAAVFGTGDADGYPDTFCDAVDLIEERLRSRGAVIIQPGLKVDGDVGASEEKALEWGKAAAAQ